MTYDAWPIVCTGANVCKFATMRLNFQLVGNHKYHEKNGRKKIRVGSLISFFVQRGENVCSSHESESESSVSPVVPGTSGTSRPSACEPPSKKTERDFKEEWRAEFHGIVFDSNAMF